MINAPPTVTATVTESATARPSHPFALLGDVRVVLAFCIVVGLIPVWSVPWVPTIDGPIHVYIVYLLDQLAQPGTSSFHRVFEYNNNIEPNFTVYGVIWLFSRFMTYLVAEKMFVSLYWVTFALSSFYAMSFFGRRASVLALLMLPFAFGYYFHFGFYNFVFSQALFLLSCGYALRHIERLRLRSLLVLGALMLALTVTHLVGIVMFLFFLAASRLGIALRDWWTSGAPRDLRAVATAFVLDGVKIMLVALPSLAIVIDFALRRVATDETTAMVLTNVQKAFYIASISPIFSIDKREMVALLPYVALVWLSIALLATAMVRNRAALISGLPVLLPAALLAGIVAVGTLGFAGFDALPRLMPFLFLTAILALGLVPPARWRHVATVVVVTGGLTLTSFFHAGFYRQINTMYDGFALARPAPMPETAIVAINVADQQHRIAGGETGWRMDVTEHFRDRYAREAGAVMANIELLSPRIYGYFPVQYRATATLDEKLMKPEFGGHRALLAEFQRSTGVPVSEVSFWPSIPRSQWASWGYPEGQRVLFDELDAKWRRLPADGALSSEIYVRR